ncbi:MAG: 3-deoxy-7-phosphoheptulonate synthase [Puniceicoccales bacterium]|jgi:3-deoxy-7-phosphoheptulonate synthase|nr:3-deoxy-7-phosphoheptulonate synthase [Puniceicoccales bacterium]
MVPTQNLRVRETVRLLSPKQLKALLPVSGRAHDTVVDGRKQVSMILDGQDKRLLVVVGPCSIHDRSSAIEYATRLDHLKERLKEQLCIIMRVYFEKPRTTLGWKGLINDPFLNGSYDIENGLKTARELLIHINAMGLPVATEFLDPYMPQYLDDLVAWAAIGARTTESQTHREMASALSMPVGFKNATDGSLQIAIDAMIAAQSPHSFLGMDGDGYTAIVRSLGVTHGHVVLRGGKDRPNYEPEFVNAAVEALRKASLRDKLMVDCSHANSGKNHENQVHIFQSVIAQRKAGNLALASVMLESHLHEGRQNLGNDPSSLKYGVSITDSCISWETTEELLIKAAEAEKARA